MPAEGLALASEFVLGRLKEFDARRDLTRAERQRRAVDLEETAKELRKTFLSLWDANGLILLAPEEAA